MAPMAVQTLVTRVAKFVAAHDIDLTLSIFALKALNEAMENAEPAFKKQTVSVIQMLMKKVLLLRRAEVERAEKVEKLQSELEANGGDPETLVVPSELEEPSDELINF